MKPDRDPPPFARTQARAPRRLLLLAATFWSLIAAIFVARAWGRAIDDFFITFRYADNFARGLGFAFNPGEHVFGTTAPGFAAILGVLRTVTRIPVPGLGTLTTGIALVGLAVLLLHELARNGRAGEGLLAGTIIVTSSYVWPLHGSEIPLALLLLGLAATLAGSSPVWAGVLAALAAWCRPELAAGAAIVAVIELFRTRALPRAYVLSLAAAGLSAMVFDRVTMGSFLPVTLAAKRAQAQWLPGTFASGAGFWEHSLQKVAELGFGALTSLVLGLGLAGAPFLWARGGRAARILILQCAVLAVVYPILGVADYPWYAIPMVLLLSAALPVGAGVLVRAAHSQAGAAGRARSLAPWLAAAGLLLPFLLVWPSKLRDTYAHLVPNQHYDLYRRTGEWFQANTAPGATIAYVEVGTIGFFSGRQVQDLLGLVTPRSIPYVSTGDMAGAFLAAPPDYFIFDRNLFGFLDPLMHETWFRQCYRKMDHLDALPGGAERVIIYRRLPGAVFPPSRPPKPREETAGTETEQLPPAESTDPAPTPEPPD